MVMHRTKLAQVVVSLLAATTIQTLAAADLTGTGTATHRASGKPPAKATAHPASLSGAPKSPITISLTSRIRQGNLVVALDNVPVFNEPFHKPPFLISQTTRWDPLQVSAGKHRLTAKIYDAKGKTYVSSTYDLDVARSKGLALRIRIKGDGLTIEPES